MLNSLYIYFCYMISLSSQILPTASRNILLSCLKDRGEILVIFIWYFIYLINYYNLNYKYLFNCLKNM